MEGNGEETLRIRYTKGSHGMRCATWTAPAKTVVADEAHVPGACPRANRRTDHRGASATVDFGRDRRSGEAGPT